jgi:5-oxoprolinase (ATP-hydrolysing)
LQGEGKEETNRRGAEGEQEDGDTEEVKVFRKVHLRYEGTDTALIVDFGDIAAMKQQFEKAHQQQYGFIAEEKGLIVEIVVVRDIIVAAMALSVAFVSLNR